MSIKKKKPRNSFELRIHRQLSRAKVKFKYESEQIPYVLAKHYIPDFILTTPRGKIYVECKGYLRPTDKAKLVAVKRQHPNLDIRILFYEDREKNTKWATKNHFIFAVHKIPGEWLNG